jgi:hypothetical protein
MSGVWILIGVLFVVTVAFKAAGPLLLGQRTLAPRAASVISLLAPALLTSLILSQTFNASSTGLQVDARLVGFVVAGVALAGRLPIVAVIVLAAGATAVTRLVAG